jgi:hypothetical protein
LREVVGDARKGRRGGSRVGKNRLCQIYGKALVWQARTAFNSHSIIPPGRLVSLKKRRKQGFSGQRVGVKPRVGMRELLAIERALGLCNPAEEPIRDRAGNLLARLGEHEQMQQAVGLLLGKGNRHPAGVF